MKINSNCKIIGKSVILVPYRKYHVEKYHKWMTSKELQDLTASEPLSLKDEYEMQESWLNDDDKCTFIILDKELFSSSKDEVKSMIGDTNVFLNVQDKTLAEAEIMIAEVNFRQKGKGKEAMLLMFKYAIENLNIKTFSAKIGFFNKPSIAMFEKMKFEVESKSDVFQETTFFAHASAEWTEWLNNSITFYNVQNH